MNERTASNTPTPRAPGLRGRMALTIGPYLIAIALLVLISSMSMDTLSAVRAYVGGESLWSKAQKEAVAQLDRYAAGDAAAFQRYQDAIRVPLGDRRARLELERAAPDLAVARAGLVEGRNHPDDIDGMMQLFRRFRHVAFMDEAIGIWAEADGFIDDIVTAGDELRAAQTPAADADAHAGAIEHALARLHAADRRLTPLEEAFSATLGNASRSIRTILKVSTIALALLLLVFAVLFSVSILGQHASMERALRLSEERFDLAVRGSNDGIWNWSEERNELYFSPRATELLGYLPEDMPMTAARLLATVHIEDRDAVRRSIRAMLRHHAPLDIEFRFPNARGVFGWLQVRGRALTIVNGRSMRVAGSITDIGERKRADEMRQQLSADAQRRSERAQIALLEQVQSRMGRELHDDLGQQLTGVAFLAKALEQRLLEASSAERDQVSWIVKLINEAIDRIRFMSRQLSPISIDEITLGAALKRLADDIRHIFGTRIELRMSGDEAHIPPAHASQFFRIAQESINNA
ncbi:MAG TPA: PAS domain-containing protein, partial [Rudaea sp.]